MPVPGSSRPPSLRPVRAQLTVFVTYYAASASDLPSYEFFNASLQQSVPFAGVDDDDKLFYGDTSITLAPPSGANAATACLGASLVIRTTAFAIGYKVSSSTVLVNVHGNFAALTDPNSARAGFSSLRVDTQDAPVYLDSIFLEDTGTTPPFTLYPDFGPALGNNLVVTSKTGEVFLNKVTGSGIAVTTSGTIHSNTVVSTKVHSCGVAVCGDLRYTATGDGRIAHTAVLGGSALYFATDRGALVVANSAILFSSTFTITSGAGNIVLSNFLSAYGNETIISSTGGGSINMASTFINRAIVTATGAGKVSVTFDFMGTPTPPSEGDEALVIPFPPRNYSLPLLKITTDRGDIAIIGAGGSPTGDFADVASLDFRSNLGNIKAEVNGDGIYANYSVSSERGTEIVEIDGKRSPLTGQLGAQVGSGLNYVFIHSAAGDVQLSEMPKPY